MIAEHILRQDELQELYLQMSNNVWQNTDCIENTMKWSSLSKHTVEKFHQR